MLIAAVTACSLAQSSRNDNHQTAEVMTKSENTRKYGDNAPKIWTPLTPLEMSILGKMKDSPDHGSNMILSLFFTSDIREDEKIGMAIEAYFSFIELCDRELPAIKDAKQRAGKLHELFYKQFIVTPKEKEEVSSGVYGLLIKKEYDANVAALLFAIIAQKYDFTTKFFYTKREEKEIKNKDTGLFVTMFAGVSYLELKHAEMYSPVLVIPFVESGFDPYVNNDYYNELHKLYPTIFEDGATEFKRYYAKTPFSFEQALLTQYKIDKLNEPTDVEHSAMNRRIEMAAILTDSCDLLIDRLKVWKNTIPHILRKNIAGEMLTFIDTIQTELVKAAGFCDRETEFTDIAWDLFLFSALEYSGSLDGPKLKSALSNGYQFLSVSSDDYDKKKTLLANALFFYLNKIIETESFEELENVKEVIAAVPETEIRTEASSSFYYNLGEYYLAKGEIWAAGQFFTECAFVEGSRFQATCTKKGVDALYGYAAECLKKGVCATAADARDKCLEKIPDKTQCEKIIKLYKEKCQ